MEEKIGGGGGEGADQARDGSYQSDQQADVGKRES